MTTSHLITGWRTSAGLSRMQLAGALAVHVSSVSGWERGAPCSAATVGAIGRACGVADLPRLAGVALAAGEGEAWGRVVGVVAVHAND